LKTNALLIAAAIYLALVGLGFLLVPGVMVFGALGGTPATIVAELRQYGGALLGIAALNWVARNAEVSTAMNGIFLGIIGEYVGRIYNQVRSRPTTVVEYSVNLSKKPLDVFGTDPQQSVDTLRSLTEVVSHRTGTGQMP